MEKNLESKRAWAKGDYDRRQKDGSREDRRDVAACIRRGRNMEERLPLIEKEKEHSAMMFAVCFILALILFCVFAIKGHTAEIVDIHIIGLIESSGDPLAYNVQSGAVGLYQICPIVLKDYNVNHDDGYHSKYTLDEMYNADYASLVATWYINFQIPEYLTRYKISDTITSRLIAYNWGIGHLRKWFKNGSHWNKLPKETRQYVKRYFAELKGND